MQPSTSAHGLPPHLLRPRLRGLYVITDADMGGGHLVIAAAALAGGAAVLQLRDKTSAPRHLVAVARALRTATREVGALFIVNDRLDLALACGADGVHLGPEDLPLAVARRLLGPHRLLGASCGDAAEVRAAERAGADYLGIGPVFGTATKGDAGPPLGVQRLRELAVSTTLPVAAIGGLNVANIAATTGAGAAMYCVVSAIAGAGDATAMLAATRELKRRTGLASRA